MRCHHGFIHGLCQEPLCPSWDGLAREPRIAPLPCESCGGPRVSGNQSRERVCARCIARAQAERTRRESQEAYFGGAQRWS